MSAQALEQFHQIWLADFEFCQPDGEQSKPICLVAHEIRSNRTIRLWQDELYGIKAPPFPVGADALFVAYFASAELGCFLALDWPMPARILDLYVEFRCLTNGKAIPCGNGLLGALSYYDLDAIEGAEKDSMRQLAMRGGPYTDAERIALLDYCQTDVTALGKLLPRMLPGIDLPRALLRGRYMAAVAHMESMGVPIDLPTLEALRHQWGPIKGRLIAEVDADYGVFIPTGQRTLNPESAWGGAVLREAKQLGVDPHELADAATEVWQTERRIIRDRTEAIKNARKTTGLSTNRISQWENSGRDYSTYPHLDTLARELAAEYPELGIGRGYQADEVYDDTDHAGRLWDVLREEEDSPKPRHHADILRKAAELVYAEADGQRCYDQPMTFSAARWAGWLAKNGIPWPLLESGALVLDDNTFRQMSKAHPEVSPIRELRHSLSELRLESLAVGSDGRNRTLLSPFRARTGRNQPSNSRFIFGPSCWLRGLIKPEPGRAVAYIDWSNQEYAIAAALSRDVSMMAAYNTGDPYLAFAKQVGAVPERATKETHGTERAQFKICCLGVQYGMRERSLAQLLGEPEAHARMLLRLHRETYPAFWCWSQAAVDRAMLHGELHTVFGWRIHSGPNVNPRSLANFPMQANGAEMLRLACCLATERGISVCAPIHDALLVEGPVDEIDDVVADAQEAMEEASRIVLDGFPLRTDSEVICYPDRYMDPRGERMWETIMGILEELHTTEEVAF